MLQKFRNKSTLSPDEVTPHPEQIDIYAFYAYEKYSIILMASTMNQEKETISTNFFYCTICKKWLKFSGTSGNINSHIKSLHLNLIQPEEMKPLSRAEALQHARKFILMKCLPFSVVNDQHFAALIPGLGTRKNMADLCTKTAGIIRHEMKARLQKSEHIWISFDAWSDPQLQTYLGINALCMYNMAYSNFMIAHKPLISQEKDAGFLSAVIHEVLEEYQIDKKVEGCVTDNANVMKAVASALEIQRRPCYCHLMNLIIRDFIDASQSKIGFLTVMQKTLSCSSKWQSFIMTSKANVLSLPSYTQTRWYSIFSLIKNSILLQPYIETFYSKYNLGDIPNNFFDYLSEIVKVIGTARNAMMILESDSFGTISKVIACFRMLKDSLNELDRYVWEYEIDVFNMSYDKYWERNYKKYKDELLICSILNPRTLNTSAITEEEKAYAKKVLTDMEINSFSESVTNPTQTIDANNHQFGMSFQDFLAKRTNTTTKSELAHYLVSNCSEHADHLDDFWNLHRASLPKLASIAFKYLSIPASSSASERCFSKAKNLVPAKRLAMKKSRIEDSVIIAANPTIAEMAI